MSVYSTYSGGTLSGLLASTTASETYAGYHTVDLPSLVSLTAGSKFYVCLYLPGGGLAADGVYTFRDSSGDITLSDSACTASPGESYYSSNGASWTDLQNQDPTANFCINALTVPVQAPTVTAVSSTNTAGVYKTGQKLTVTVTFNAPVTVTGTPQLALKNGGVAYLRRQREHRHGPRVRLQRGAGTKHGGPGLSIQRGVDVADRRSHHRLAG